MAANAIGVVGLSLLLVVGGYKKYQAGQLSWKVVGLWAAGLSALGTGDFFLSRYVTPASLVTLFEGVFECVG